MSKLIQLLPLLFLVIILNACQNQTKQQQHSSQEIIYDTLNLTYEGEKNDSNSYFKVKYALLDFKLSNKKVNDSLQFKMREYLFNVEPELSKSLEVQMNEDKKKLLEEYQSLQADFPDGTYGYEHELTQNVISIYKKFIGIETQRYAYAAGAHGMYWENFLNIDLTTGSTLQVDDFFKSQKKLLELAESNFRKQMELKEKDDLEQYGFWFTNNRFHLNNNFNFRNDSIEFQFSQYEIAPYVMGNISIKLPLKALQEDLKQEMFDN
ncbi:MAG: RsiV family protein [Bacteroidia bacterium]